MKKSKRHLKDLGKGHEYGKGRSSEPHRDVRTKRKRSRGDNHRKAVEKALEES